MDLKEKKVAVLGADGMLGNHIVRELLDRNYLVRAVVQPGRSNKTLDGLGVQTISADLLDIESLGEALSEVGSVINAAASTQIWPGRSRKIWEINYEGVRNIATFVQKNRIAKLVQIGTANSFAPGSKEKPGTEEGPYTDFRYKLDYQDSKFAAQTFLLEQARNEALPVTIVNPTFMFGAFDTKPGSGQMILSLYTQKTPGYTQGGKSYVAAKDVAFAAVQALEKGRVGECYLIAGENLSYKEAFDRICRVLGVPAPRYAVHPFLSLFIGALGSIGGIVFKKAPKISYPMARIANQDCYYSNHKARIELGLPQTPFETAVSQAFQWFQENNYV